MTAIPTVPIYAGNDFGGQIYLELIDPATSVPGPCTTGPVTALIGLTETDTTPVLPALSVTLNYIGNLAGQVPGDWSYFFDGGSLVRASLDALATKTLFLIVRKPDDRDVVQKLAYSSFQRATLPA